MKKQSKYAHKTVKLTHLDFDEFYREISHAWEEKAKDLQARRWKIIKQSKWGHHHAH